MRDNLLRTMALVAVLTLTLPMHVAEADFEEECVEENCDNEESEELHESYESECFEETCDVEEVREIAGTRGNINAMLNDFQNRGFRVNPCHRIGACTASPGNNTTSFDDFFDRFCNQSSIDQHWDDFEMSKSDWDGSFGYDAPCNQNLPLGRTFNALNLLDFFGTSRRSGSTNFLPFFYEYSAGTDELLGRCGSGCPGSCPGCGQQTFATHFSGIDEYIELYWPFFYNQNVFQRAGTIVHESRHDDKGHDGGTTCGNGGSCDTTWGYNGANRYQVLYLWWLSACADNVGVTTGFRNQVVTSANSLWNTFNTRPSRLAVFGPGVSNPGGAALVPPASVCPAL
jgi:hypothetical protein